MKKFKISFICLFLAAALLTGSAAIYNGSKGSEVFQNDTPYITAENLALNCSENKKLTDGNVNTVYNSYTKGMKNIDIDLTKEKEFNSIVLKEQGLNIHSFSILISSDKEEYTTIYKGDKIEYHRLCTFDNVKARYVRVIIESADSFWALKEIEIYNQETVSSKDFKTVGYVLNSDFYEIMKNDDISDKHRAIGNMLNSYHISGLTHINFYCGVGFDAQGNVFFGNDEKENNMIKQETQYMIDCMREFGRDDLKITYVVGIGSNNENTNPAMADNQEKFIENLISLCNELGIDGIDFDYEFPQSDYDYQVFDNFIVKLKQKMLTNMNCKDNCILSCAFGTMGVDYSKEAIESLDIVNMMTYDIFDQDGEHSSFWSCAVQGAKYLESVGFSKEQINIGIPFYGTQTDALMEQYIYKNADSFDYFDNYYTFPSYYDGSPTDVYFNSPAIVRDKTAYALLNGYGGIMVWHFACDTEYSSEYSLWKGAYSAIEQFGGEAR